MQVRLLVSVAGLGYCGSVGEVLDVPAVIGRDLVEAGFAVACEEIEIAVKPAQKRAEKAVKPAATRKRKDNSDALREP